MNKETIQMLGEVRRIDIRLDEIEASRGDLPAKIAEMQEHVDELQEKVDRFSERRDELASEMRTLQNEVAEHQAELKKDEESLFNVTNNKEYDALTHQINFRKEKIEENDERIKEIEEKLEKIDIRLNSYREELNGEQEKQSALKEELEQKIKETEADEKALLKERDSVFGQLDNPTKRIYTKIRKTKAPAVSEMVRNSCSECHSVVPLQRQSELRNHKKLVICETCGRILIDPVIDTVDS